jgi:hypothetical protein
MTEALAKCRQTYLNDGWNEVALLSQGDLRLNGLNALCTGVFVRPADSALIERTVRSTLNWGDAQKNKGELH